MIAKFLRYIEGIHMPWVPKKIAQKGFGQERNEWSKMHCTNWISIECEVLLQHLNDQDL
jgi:hypothetical protein